MKTLNCHGQLIDLSVPKIMGIINVTPDSFYDGGKNFSEDALLKTAERMLEQGAAFLDVGGYSTRAGAAEISETEEISRTQRAIGAILKNFPKTFISIDTFRSKVAAEAITHGASMVNDVSGGSLDPLMFETVATLNVPYVLMHMRGTPKTMARLTQYKDVTLEVIKDLSEKMHSARAAGISDIIIDPGFGFAKTRQQSFELLNHLELFGSLDTPILAGVSRKSFVYKTLDVLPDSALNGTTALNMVALTKGASILRVHDVKQAAECVKLFQNLNFQELNIKN